MRTFKHDEKYLSMACYSCVVIAVTVLLVLFGINFPAVTARVRGFLSTISPIAIGAVIAYLLNPVFRFCEGRVFAFVDKLAWNRHLRRVLSLILTYLFALLVMGTLVLLIVPQITSNYEELFTKIGDYINKAIVWADGLISRSGLFENYEGLSDLINATDLSNSIQRVLSVLSSSIVKYSGRFLSAFTGFLLGMILSVYFLFRKEKILAGIRKLSSAILPKNALTRLIGAARFADRTFGRFLVGTIFDSLLVGLVVLIILSIVRMPYAPLISAIVCITNVIPFFGPFLGAIPSFLIIFLVDPKKAFWFIVIILIVQQIDGNIIAPKILGNSIGISSMWIIIAITVMGGLLGMVGMFIGVPLFAILYAFIKYLVEMQLKKRSLPVDTSYYEKPGEGDGGEDDPS